MGSAKRYSYSEKQVNMMYKAAVITISDRSFHGERPDLAGPAVAGALNAAGYEVCHTDLVPDEIELIQKALCHAADDLDIGLIITTGGTGFAPRDVTPEATTAVCERMTPGIPEAMRYASMKITPRGMLSRSVAGIRGKSLIINLPGSPKAAIENLDSILPAIGHGLEMLRGIPMNCADLN